MKNFINYLGQGCSIFNQGLAKKLGMLAVGTAFCLSPLGLTTASAATASTTSQLDYIQTLVQLLGEKDLFSSTSTSADYIQWATSKGMKPGSGWSANGTLTRDDLAQTLAQLYSIKPEKGGDYAAALEKNGIALPTGDVVTRTALVGVVDDFGFQSKLAKTAKIKKSKHTKKSPTKPKSPKKPTKKPTPKKATPPKPVRPR